MKSHSKNLENKFPEADELLLETAVHIRKGPQLEPPCSKTAPLLSLHYQYRFTHLSPIPTRLLFGFFGVQVLLQADTQLLP
jgi:hypothetical protein